MHKAMTTSKSPSYATPEWLYRELNGEFNFNDDPCPLSDNGIDGLLRAWGTRTYCNPPYGRHIGKWMMKAYQEADGGELLHPDMLVRHLGGRKTSAGFPWLTFDIHPVYYRGLYHVPDQPEEWLACLGGTSMKKMPEWDCWYWCLWWLPEFKAFGVTHKNLSARIIETDQAKIGGIFLARDTIAFEKE